MKKWVEDTTKILVGEKDFKTLTIETIEGNDVSATSIRGPREVLGAIIGKQGRTAAALRLIMNVASKRNKKKYLLDVSPITETNVETIQ